MVRVDPTERIGVAVRRPFPLAVTFPEAAWKESVVEVITSDADSLARDVPLRRGRELSVAIRELEYTAHMGSGSAGVVCSCESSRRG